MNEQLEFNIGDDEKPATVEVAEDGSEARVIEEAPEPEPKKKAEETSGEDLDEYSDKVKRRIDKLTARLRETERREQAALEYAKQVQARAAQAEKRLVDTDGARIGEASGRIETQRVALRQIILKAREEGDFQTETEANEQLAAINFERERLKEAEANRAAYEAQVAQQQQLYQQQQQQLLAQQQAAQQRAQVDPRAEEWAERNEWYGRDVAMTAAVRGIHLQMVTQEGIDPRTDHYYNELDRRVHEAFPHKFQSVTMNTNSRTNRPVQTVAPASRSSGINQVARRTVRLTSSQVATAKKLGVPLEEYAKYVKE